MSKRMRVFAGPNGSGKSSIIKSILNTKVKEGKTLDFGIYINADDLAVSLHDKGCFFSTYKVNVSIDEFLNTANDSGLVNNKFSSERLRKCIILKNNQLTINKKEAVKLDDHPVERIAQISADFLRKKLLSEGKKFSFETVFSHQSKVDIIKQAKENGYKVYLYFVSTEHPRINVYRVKIVRVGENGHDVDKDLIISRYYRSMNLMYNAAQHSYQAYFFDNSVNGSNHTMFAHFKINSDGKKQWDDFNKLEIPNWFKEYYSAKIKK